MPDVLDNCPGSARIALVESLSPLQISAGWRRLWRYTRRRSMRVGRGGDELLDEGHVRVVAEADRDPIGAAAAKLDAWIGLQLGSAFTDDDPSQAHLDHADTLEVGDLLAIDPIGIAIAEHRLRDTDPVDRDKTTLQRLAIAGHAR